MAILTPVFSSVFPSIYSANYQLRNSEHTALGGCWRNHFHLVRVEQLLCDAGRLALVLDEEWVAIEGPDDFVRVLVSSLADAVPDLASDLKFEPTLLNCHIIHGDPWLSNVEP